MNALFLARRFPPSVGGMERFAFDLANSLAEKTKIKRITWGGSNKWLPIVLPNFFIRACFLLLVRRDIEVIHIQDAVQAPIGWLLRVLFRKPYIVVAHGLDITYTNAFYQRVIIPFVRRADAVISISSATNDEVIKRGVDAKKTYVITLGIHDDYTGNPRPNRKLLADELRENLEGKLLLLTTGRLVKRKGVAWFVANVLPKIVRHKPNTLYLVAGTGAEHDNIVAAIKAAGMTEYVRMMGRVSDEVRSALYQSCDIFVMPNIKVLGDMEGFGIVVHEAAVAGLPVVASNLEGIADALHHNKNGILVESANAEQFVDEIKQFLDNNKARKEFGEKARNYTLETYSWSKIAERYVDVYNKVKQKK